MSYRRTTQLNKLNQERGSSSWLTSVPLTEEGLFGEKFDLHHALSSKKGGFVSLLHNLARSITSSLLSKLCKDVVVEPQLHPLTRESFTLSTATGNEVRLDMCAHGFWQAGQIVFFDVC